MNINMYSCVKSNEKLEEKVLKIQFSDKELTAARQATMAVNNKMHYSGYSAKELLTNTNVVNGENLKLEDKELINLQTETNNRSKGHRWK